MTCDLNKDAQKIDLNLDAVDIEQSGSSQSVEISQQSQNVDIGGGQQGDIKVEDHSMFVELNSLNQQVALVLGGITTSLSPIVISPNVGIFQINGKNVNKRWLHFNNSPSNLIGFPVTFNGKIRKIAINCQQSVPSATFSIRRNNELTDLYTATLINENFKVFDNLLIDVSFGDILRVYVQSTGNLNYPMIMIGLKD